MTPATDPTPDPRPTRRWPVGLFGMLALVAAVERSVARNEIRVTTVMTSAWTQSGPQLSKATRSAVVCFGDSLVKDGVLPPVLERGHGLSAWNLALPKGMAPAHYFLLRRLLRSGARPAAVLIDGEVLRDDPLAETRVWPELAGPAECADLARTGRDAPFLARALLGRLLISFRARHEIRSAVLAALDGTTPLALWSLTKTWRNWNANRGAYVLTDRVDPPGVDPRLPELAVAGHLMAGWACHPVNDAYVRRFLDLAEAHGVPVFWLLPPTHPALQLGRARHGWDAAYVAYLRRLQARYPRLTVVDARHAGYPAQALVDVLHLGRTAAIFYTDSLGAVLRDRLAPAAGPRDRAADAALSRWVNLPRYDAPAAADLAAASPVEDLERSALASAPLSSGDRVRR